MRETADALLARHRRGDRRSRARVHGAAAEPRHRAHARPRSRRRRSARDLGEGPDGEHVPGHESHRARRGLRGRVPRVRRRTSTRTSKRAPRSSPTAPPPTTCSPGCCRLTDDGEQLPRRQIRALVRNLITGGLTTTSQLLGNLLHEILSNPERRARDPRRRRGARSRDRREPAPGAADPVHGARLRAGRRDRRLPGARRHARDHRASRRRTATSACFDDPDTFRVDRANAEQHLTFGYGPHVCPGASQARAVAVAGIRAFLDRFPAGTVASHPASSSRTCPPTSNAAPAPSPSNQPNRRE